MIPGRVLPRPHLGGPTRHLGKEVHLQGGLQPQATQAAVQGDVQGATPNSLELGWWGVFPAGRYTPESLQCFKCEALGHVQKQCGAGELCGVCIQRVAVAPHLRVLLKVGSGGQVDGQTVARVTRCGPQCALSG